MSAFARPTSFQPPDSSSQLLETTVGGILREAAESAAEAIALVDGTPDQTRRRRWTFADLLTDSERVARALLGGFVGASWLFGFPREEVQRAS